MPKVVNKAASQPRNKGFQKSHQQIIDTAIKLISKNGIKALSIAELARELNVNRTTIYYHFKDREQLIAEVKQWASSEISVGMDLNLTQNERIDRIVRFVLENDELIKLWLDDFLSGDDIYRSYPLWDTLVSGVREIFANSPKASGLRDIDAEIYCLNMLLSVVITPKIYKNSIHPQLDDEVVIERFRTERMRTLLHDLLAK
jgi:AcrR family transcriptional regulator